MAITLSTTLAVAATKDDRTIKLTSGTSAAVGMTVKMEQEWSTIAAIASDGVTITLGVRGQLGSIASGHKILSPVEVSAAADFAGTPTGVAIPIPYNTPLVTYYGAAGQITIPNQDANIFLTEGAASKTLALKRREFIEEDLPDVFASMQLLGVDLAELEVLFQNYRKQAAKGGKREKK